MFLDSLIFMHIKHKTDRSFLGPPECWKHLCVPHTISLAKHRRCCSGEAHHPWNALVLVCFTMTPNLLSRQWRRWCEKQQFTAGSQSTCKREVKICKRSIFTTTFFILACCKRVPACLENQLLVYRAGSVCPGMGSAGPGKGALLNTLVFFSWHEEKEYLWLQVTAEGSW